MTRPAVFVACVVILCLGATVAVQAEPIRISGGSLVFSSPGPVSLGELSVVGNRGFSMVGIVDSGETRIDPSVTCFPCLPSSTISIGADIVGVGFGGSATLDGQSYPNINSLSSSDFIELELFGTIDVPAFQRASTTAVAPFDGRGIFFRSEPFLIIPIRARGIVTLSLAPEPGPTWELTSLRYDFTTVPTPEPGTLLLLASGVVALVHRGRALRRSSQPLNLQVH